MIMKRLVLYLFIFMCTMLLVSCNQTNNSNTDEEKRVTNISFDTTLIDDGILKEDFKLDLIKVNVSYNDDTNETFSLTEDLIKDYDYENLHVGNNSFVVTYKNLNAILSIKIIEKEEPVDVYYTVVFVNMNGDIIEQVKIKENTTLDEPIEAPVVDGYVFTKWSVSFPLLVLKDEIVFAEYEEDKTLDNAIIYLNKFIKGIKVVSKNISLPLNYEGVEISWSSSDETRLSSNGVYTKDYEEKQVELTAILSYGEKTMEKKYYVTSKGFKSLKGPIASTYLYRNYDKLTDEFFETMDIVYCAFVSVDENGNYKTGNSLNNMSRYVIPKAHENGIYVIPSMGGGDSAAANVFSKIASSDTTRKNFANSMVTLINTYGFDGIDIDWEVPKSSEKENYTLLMKELYNAVKANNPHHLVTSAIGGGMWQPPRYDLENSGKYHDYINVMLYSMCSSSGQYQNALYPSKNKNDSVNGCGYTLTSCSFTETVKIYNDLGIPSNKLILGLAFYGVKQVKTDGAYKSGGSVFYTTLKSSYLNNSNYKYVYDEVAQVPYLISTDGATFISFDDSRSIKAKAAYVIESGCAGLMTWENGCDLSGDLVHAMKEGLGK